MSTSNNPLFPLGRVIIKPDLDVLLRPTDVADAISRHLLGDWDDDHSEAREQANRVALATGMPIVSFYRSQYGISFFVITNRARQTTTILSG